MSVHTAITAHSKKQHDHIEAFLQLDEQREQAIERALEQYKLHESCDVQEINRITREINGHALKGISPTRMLVTEAMIAQYANQLKQTEA
jgi:predicted chitinase